MVLNLRAVLTTLGFLVFFLGLFLMVPALTGLVYGEDSWWAYAVTGAGCLAIGVLAWVFKGPEENRELRIREGFAIVAISWFLLSVLGALPMVLAGTLDSYTNAFFETISGFTTTGATILGGADTPAIEDVPKSFLMWRSLTHWMGGMGIIVLTLAILPLLGVGGMQLYKAEVPGPSADKLTPRVRDTAKRLWMIYVGITAIQVVALLPAMSFFDSVNHAMATLATGGFSTLNGSVGQFGSGYVDAVVTVFMFLAGVNFALHYRMLRGEAVTVFKDVEFRVYVGIVVVSTLILTFSLWSPTLALLPDADPSTVFAGYASLLDAFRFAAFQAVAIITTTGFGTADYELWPPLAVGVIFLCFFIGGMAGSTGGGVKVIRHVLMFKNSFKELKQLVHPQAILPVRLAGRTVSADVLKNVVSFIVLYLGLIGFGTLSMAFLGMDVLSAFGATLSSVGNIGPAFGTFGPTENYAHLPDMGKWVLSFLMLAGRLEIFTVIIVFVPAFWRR
jgi:trk system potassium uptake protein TrkH